MKISHNKVVAVNYYLTGSKGQSAEELIEQTSAENPFVFLVGHGGVLPDFETHLSDKTKGDKFDFRIGAAKAYGNYEQDYVAKLDKSIFMVDGKFDSERIKVGEDVEMNDQDGNRLVGHVLEVSDNHVDMDFNHPLAGYDLHFIGEVLDVREASAEEIDHGHVHGPGGHHHH
ncbi:MAG: FKBP-type peptidyl-prolyl cis-trans isomerase [Bacteroidetes bacterium]|jgi:FKBP-type peptidyl-prolyl cis-trans isomerase SlyD|nr:FKBP-type peptidyl-prolyl cis-trans isomerase [Bacteroidota bacterium]MCA6442316.1 FKBP-type peptidyl-prolyl cis-trans isomerase [Bacteroidota bacterium]